MLGCRDAIVADAERRLAGGDVPGACVALRALQQGTIDERTLELTDPALDALRVGKRLVASFDPQRRPAADEIVIVYGNYPHVFENVVVNNPIRRHVADFWNFSHDRVEYHPAWSGVERIFVINAVERRDRYDAVLRELASARAPLHRVVRIEAVKEPVSPLSTLPRTTIGQIGCLASHLQAMEAVSAGQLENCMVLEDDFCFTSDLPGHLDDLELFFARAYDFLVCLLATSKYGAVEPMDDLLARSYQECTNTGGYVVSRAGAEALRPIFRTALARMRAGEDVNRHAVDRCWASLQPTGRFCVFRRKFGFQTASLSDIEGTVTRYLD